MAVAITRTADPAGAGSGTTITYSAQSIGTAEDDRIIVVCVGSELTSGTPSSATLNYGAGAIAMNSSALASFGVMGARVFWLPAPTGTTADIAVTFGASQGSTTHHICVYSVTGAAVESTGTNTSTDMDASTPLTTGSLTIRGSGGFIGIAVGATDTVAKTWANATEDLDEDAGTFRFTTATRVTALTATAVTCTGGTNQEDGALAWILLRPGVIGGAGSYALTGTAASGRHGYSIAAAAGSYTLTGTAATPKRGQNLAAAAGSFALTGTAATPLHAWKLAAAAGSFTLTGTAAGTLQGFKAAAGAGSFALAGTAASLRRNLPLVAGAGSFSLSGTDATPLHAWKLAAAAGSFALTGTAASPLHGWKVSAGVGSYSLTGTDATLTYQPAGAFSLAAGAGSFALTGSAASTLHAWTVAAGAGSFALTGTDATLTLGAAETFTPNVLRARIGTVGEYSLGQGTPAPIPIPAAEEVVRRGGGDADEKYRIDDSEWRKPVPPRKKRKLKLKPKLEPKKPAKPEKVSVTQKPPPPLDALPPKRKKRLARPPKDLTKIAAEAKEKKLPPKRARKKPLELPPKWVHQAPAEEFAELPPVNRAENDAGFGANRPFNPIESVPAVLTPRAPIPTVQELLAVHPLVAQMQQEARDVQDALSLIDMHVADAAMQDQEQQDLADIEALLALPDPIAETAGNDAEDLQDIAAILDLAA